MEVLINLCIWGGSITHSELTFNEVDAFNCNRFLHVNNDQAINIYVNHGSFEDIRTEVFYFQKGGFFYVKGGSYINPGTLLRLNDPSGFGIGQNTQIFSLFAIKMEGYQNIDNSKKPKLFDCNTLGISTLIIDQCNNLAATDDTAEIGVLYGTTTLKIIDSQILGTVNTTPIEGYRPEIFINDCKEIPTFVNNLNSGGRYNIIHNNNYVNKYNKADFILGNTQVRTYTNSIAYAKIEAIFDTATNFDVDLDFPSNIIVDSIILLYQFSGGHSTDISLYSDSSRTQLIGSVSLIGYVYARTHRIVPTYDATEIAQVKTSGNKIYARITPSGNIGYSRFLFACSYIDTEGF